MEPTLEKVEARINAVKNQLSFSDPEFNHGLHETAFNWFKAFKKDLNLLKKFKWSLVDTFVVIPVDVANEKYLYETLREYSIQQDLNFLKYGFVLFLNSKSDKNIAQIALDRFQKEFPEINITSYLHVFSDDEKKLIDIGQIRNVGNTFVSLLANFLHKDPSKIILVSSDADAQKVSPNFLESHRKTLLENKKISATVGVWIWGLTGNFETDLYLLIDVAIHKLNRDCQRPLIIDGVEYVTGYASENMSSYTLETYESIAGLQARNKITENINLVFASQISQKPIIVLEETGVVTDSRRAINYIEMGGDAVNLSSMWNDKLGWRDTGDGNRRDIKIYPSNSKESKQSITQRVVNKLFRQRLKMTCAQALKKSMISCEDILRETQTHQISQQELIYNAFYQIFERIYLISLSDTKMTLEELASTSIQINTQDYAKNFTSSVEFQAIIQNLYCSILGDVIETLSQKISRTATTDQSTTQFESNTNQKSTSVQPENILELLLKNTLSLVGEDENNFLANLFNLDCPIKAGNIEDEDCNFSLNDLEMMVDQKQEIYQRREYPTQYNTGILSFLDRMLYTVIFDLRKNNHKPMR